MYIIFAIILISILSYLDEMKKLPSYVKWATLIFVILAVTLWFTVGGDINYYIFMFNGVEDSIINKILLGSQRNIGYYGVEYIAKYIINDFRFFRLAINIMMITLCSYTVLKNSKNLLFSLFIFMSSGIMVVYYGYALRQCIAMAIYFYIYFKFLKNDKFCNYYIGAIVCCLFHEAALITLVIPLISIYNKQIKKNENKILVISVVISTLFAMMLTRVVIVLSQMFTSSNVHLVILKYMAESSFSIVGLIFRIVLFSVVWLLYKLTKTEDEFLRIQVYTCSFSLILYIAMSNFSLVSRISDFIEMITIVTLANLLHSILNKKYKKIIFVLISALYIFIGCTDILPRISDSIDIVYNEDCSINYSELTFYFNKYYTVFSDGLADYIEHSQVKDECLINTE